MITKFAKVGMPKYVTIGRAVVWLYVFFGTTAHVMSAVTRAPRQGVEDAAFSIAPYEALGEALLDDITRCLQCVKDRLGEIDHTESWQSYIEVLSCSNSDLDALEVPLDYGTVLLLLAQGLEALKRCINNCESEETVFACLQQIKELCDHMNGEGGIADLSKLSVVETELESLDSQLQEHDDIVCSKLMLIETDIDILIIDVAYIVNQIVSIRNNERAIVSKLEVITTDLDEFEPCRPIPITAARTIDSGDPSGVYCLANDISGTITISRSDVVLDLNGHEITDDSVGVLIEEDGGPVCNVVVMNGSIRASNEGVGFGVEVVDAEHVMLEKLVIQLWNRGIYVNTASKLIINHCSILECLQGIFALTITQSLIHDNYIANGQRGVVCDAPVSVRLDRCLITDMSQAGIQLFQVDLEGSICNSTAYNCSPGFSIETLSAPILLDNCIAIDCEIAGFVISGNNGVPLVRHCIAQLNPIGFLNTSTNGQFYENRSCNNTTANYSGVSEPIESPMNARGFDNVDCDLLTEDQVDVLESKACAVESLLDELESKVDEIDLLNECAPTVVTAPLDIDTNEPSGVYCLANDINGTITISRSDVVLDLNGHRIHRDGGAGVVITGEIYGVTVKNGSIEADTEGVGIGIVCDDQDTQHAITIDTVICKDWETGIQCDSVEKLNIGRVSLCSCIDGLRVTGVAGGLIEYVLVNSAGGDGITINGASRNILVTHCTLDASGDHGIKIEDGSLCVECRFCMSRGSGEASGTGFTATDSSDVIFTECSACEHAEGFVAEGMNRITIQRCAAYYNRKGFQCAGVNNTALLSYNNALYNTDEGLGFGFQDDASTNQYYNNNACNNDTNFSATIATGTVAPVTSPQNARGFANVDCDSGDTNLLNEIFDTVCSVYDLLLGG
ncbi:MAG: right-handed parallel beta-helix repeat-containing protein [Candidatus Babeliales bacterium]